MKRLSWLGCMAALLSMSALALGPNGLTASLNVQNAAGNSGTCTASSCLQAALQVQSGTIFTPTWSVVNTVSVQVTGTWSGTISFQEAQDEGATWTAVPCQPVLSTATTVSPIPVTSTTANGNWQCDVGGFTSFRAVMSTYSSGTAVVVEETFAAIGNESVNSLPIATDAVERPISGNANRVSYAFDSSETVPTAAQSLAAIEADGTNRLYLRHVKICPGPGIVQTTAGYRNIVLFPTTAASASGSTATPNPIDAADSAFGGVARTGALTTTPAVGSVTNATAIDSWTLWVPATVAGETAQACAESFYGDAQGQKKAPAVAKTTSKGLALADLTGGAGGAGVYIITMDFSAEAN